MDLALDAAPDGALRLLLSRPDPCASSSSLACHNLHSRCLLDHSLLFMAGRLKTHHSLNIHDPASNRNISSHSNFLPSAKRDTHYGHDFWSSTHNNSHSTSILSLRLNLSKHYNDFLLESAYQLFRQLKKKQKKGMPRKLKKTNRRKADGKSAISSSNFFFGHFRVSEVVPKQANRDYVE